MLSCHDDEGWIEKVIKNKTKQNICFQGLFIEIKHTYVSLVRHRWRGGCSLYQELNLTAFDVDVTTILMLPQNYTHTDLTSQDSCSCDEFTSGRIHSTHSPSRVSFYLFPSSIQPPIHPLHSFLHPSIHLSIHASISSFLPSIDPSISFLHLYMGFR